MSDRWGDRPLGRGDGGYSNPKSVWFFRPFCCARTRQDVTQEPVALLQKAQTTSDYTRSLFFTAPSVDSPLGSFFPVLPAPGAVIFLVRKYFPSRRVRRSSPSLFYARLVAFVERRLFDPHGPHKSGSQTMWIVCNGVQHSCIKNL